MFCRRLITEAVCLCVLGYGDVICRHASLLILLHKKLVYHSTLGFTTGHCCSTLYEKVLNSKM